MTTLTIGLKSFSPSLKPFKRFFTGLLNGMVLSRQVSANQHIARYMLHEYPGHTYQSLLAELNAKTIQDMKQ